MFFVFCGFVLSADRALQLFGMGLAVAVLVDATVVRLVLVPATMELLGDRNWWLPGWLDRIVPRVHVEGRPEPKLVIDDAAVDTTSVAGGDDDAQDLRSEEHTSELQSIMRHQYAVLCLKKTR